MGPAANQNANDATGTADREVRRVRKQRALGIAVTVWTLIYGAPHLYWALGGRLGRFLVTPGLFDQPFWRLINGAATPVFMLAALLGLAMIYTSRPHWAIQAAVGVGAAIAGVHGVYGLVARAMQISAQTPPFVWWDFLVFEPWFLIEGVLLALAGWFSFAEHRSRRVWTTFTAATAVIASAAALLHLRVF